MNELEATVEKQKIHELCARYTLTIDRHDIPAWVECFAEDGVFGSGDIALRGRAKIAAYGEVHATIASRHLNTSLLFELDPSGERATGQSTTVACFATRQGYRVAFLGRYDDEVVKVDGDWVFARRWVTVDPLPEDPAFDLLSADPAVAPIAKRLLDAMARIGEPA